jgi:dTDP-4-dehydrorhamnose reductase
MKIVLTGAGGQLGRELQKIAPAHFEMIALEHQDLDITNADAVKTKIAEFKPQYIINAAAYNLVDHAETDTQLAYAINAQGPANLAQAALSYNARLVHVSTDFVFDGNQSTPYLPSDQPNPLGKYGMSKWEGEKHILALAHSQSVIIRTSWLYSSHGKNFVTSLLQAFKQRSELKMVVDQVGCPTWTNTLARAIFQVIAKNSLAGIYHWSDAGVASKYDFAVAIQEEALALKLLTKEIPIYPILSEEYPAPAKRPNYSVFDKAASWNDFAMQPLHWRIALREMLVELVK